MPSTLFECLGELHRFEDLEELLDFTAGRIVEATGWRTALFTFYLEGEAFFGAAGCPPGTKDRFRESFRRTPEERRAAKRRELERRARPGTNVCFLPAGVGPRPSSAFLPSAAGEGTWEPEDRLLVLLRGWNSEILGVLSLDNPGDGNRPDEGEFRRLEVVDRFAGVVAKLAENRFWSRRLEQSESAYRGIFEAVSDAILIKDRDGVVVQANPAACRMLGYEYSQLIGVPSETLVHPDWRDRYRRYLEDPERRGPGSIDCQSVHRDGTIIDTEVRECRFDYRGRPHLLAVLRDTTERKALLRRLLLEQKEESISAMAGGVAHDFNNFLVGVTGPLSLLRQSLVGNPAALRLLSRVETSADHLARLSGQLLAIAQGVQSETQVVRVGAVVEENLPLLEGLVRSRARLVREIEDDSWCVCADTVQLGQVLANLVLNAAEAAAGGGEIRIRVENAPRPRPFCCEHCGDRPAGDYVLLSVIDDGTGIDPVMLRHVFEPYVTTKPGGRGLGLTAVRGIVRRHGGSIRVLARERGGTTVEVLLPRAEEEPDPESMTGEITASLGERRTLLLVDDQEAVREVTREMIEALGWRAVVASGGEQALGIYGRQCSELDLVFLDVQMPGMSGVEVAEELVRMNPDVRIILTSGYTESLALEGRPTPGRNSSFLMKPYTLEALERALEGVPAR